WRALPKKRGLRPLEMDFTVTPHLLEFVPRKTGVTSFVPWNEMERWNESGSASQPLASPLFGQSQPGASATGGLVGSRQRRRFGQELRQLRQERLWKVPVVTAAAKQKILLG